MLRNVRRRRGMALPLAILVILVVGGFALSVTTMNQGLKHQVLHTSNQQWAFLLAYSAFSKMLARLQTDSWSRRPFLSGPFKEKQIPLQGGFYDLFAQDTPGKEFQADIFVRTTLAGQARMFFWRITFNDDLLDISNRIIVEFFRTGDPNDFPTAGGPNGFSQEVDRLLALRAANQKKSEDLASRLGGANTAGQVLGILNSRPPQDFTKAYPSDGTGSGDPLGAGNPAVPFPVLDPPQPGELPSAEGPGPAVGFPDFPPSNANPQNEDRGMDLNSALAEVAKLSQAALDRENSGQALHAAGNAGAGNDELNLASRTKSAALEAMEELVKIAESALNSAPSAEAAKATQELVSSTMVAAFQNIANAIAQRTQGFVGWQGIVSGINSVSEAESLATAWTAQLESVVAEEGELNGMMGQIQGYAMVSEAASQLVRSRVLVANVKTTVQNAIAGAQARAAELRAQAAAAANPPAQTPTQPEPE